MANRYWVGGTGTWDGSNTANWSTGSGGPGGASVPTSGDDVWFDGSSGSGTITIGATVSCRHLDATGFSGTISGAVTYALNVYGYFLLSATTTWTCAVTVNMYGSGWGLNLNGVTLNPFGGSYSSFDIKSGASISITSDFNSPGVNFKVSGGAFQAIGYNLIIADSTRAGTFDVFQSSSAISLNGTVKAKRIIFYIGNPNVVNFFSTAFITRDFNINLLTLPAKVAGSITLDAAAFGETDVLFTDTAAGVGRYIYPSTLVVQNSYTCTFFTTALASSSFSAIGISAVPGSRLTVKSDTTTQRFITANAGTLQNTDFQYIYANGAVIPWTGTSLGDLGNNTNITFNYFPPGTGVGRGLFFAGTF